MARRKAPAIPDDLLDQLLAGRDPGSALSAGGVLDELENRGVEDVPIAVVDGLKGFSEAVTAVFPEAQVQTCEGFRMPAAHDAGARRGRRRPKAARGRTRGCRAGRWRYGDLTSMSGGRQRGIGARPVRAA